MEKEPNVGPRSSPPYGPILSKSQTGIRSSRKKMEREGSIGLGPSKSPKSGEVIICGGSLEINKKTHEGSNEPMSSDTPSSSSKIEVSSPRASRRQEEAKGDSMEEINMEEVNSRETQCQRASFSSKARVQEMSWENTNTGRVEERYWFSIFTQFSPYSSHVLDWIPHSEEFFGQGGAIVGEAPGEGGFLLERPERDGHKGLGQVPLSILLPPKNQSPSGRELVVKEGVALQIEDREKEEDWGEEAKGIGRKVVWQGSVNSWVSQLWDTKS